MFPKRDLSDRTIGHGKVIAGKSGYMIHVDEITPAYREKAVNPLEKSYDLCECAAKRVNAGYCMQKNDVGLSCLKKYNVRIWYGIFLFLLGKCKAGLCFLQ